MDMVSSVVGERYDSDVDGDKDSDPVNETDLCFDTVVVREAVLESVNDVDPESD